MSNELANTYSTDQDDYFQSEKQDSNPFQLTEDEKKKQVPESRLTKSALGGIKNQNQPESTQSEMFQEPIEESVMFNYQYFWVNKENTEDKIQGVFKLPQYSTVHEAITFIIQAVNEQLEQTNHLFTLVDDTKQYELYKARKNGEAKTDYPALDADQTLSLTGLERVTLVELNKDAIIKKGKSSKIKQAQKQEAMVESTMAPYGSGSQISTGYSTTSGKEEVYVTEYFCCCIPRKKKVVKQETNVSLTTTQHPQQSLDVKLLGQ